MPQIANDNTRPMFAAAIKHMMNLNGEDAAARLAVQLVGITDIEAHHYVAQLKRRKIDDIAVTPHDKK